MLFKLLVLGAVIIAVLTVFSVVGKLKKKDAETAEDEDGAGSGQGGA